MEEVEVEQEARLTLPAQFLSSGQDGQDAIKYGPALNRAELSSGEDSRQERDYPLTQYFCEKLIVSAQQCYWSKLCCRGDSGHFRNEPDSSLEHAGRQAATMKGCCESS